MKIKSITPQENININHRKENGFDRAYIVLDKKGQTIAELRTYWPANDVYACLWVHYGGIYATGSGRAGGYGYDKRSAAASEAFSKAGIKTDKSFHGSGNQMQALEALGRHLAKRQFLTVVEAYA